ncbi:Phosphorylated carbohydrates phosphatase [Hordeum vulgare]|nr:Phosphorylated carbohydrates phosphatase [Hordeum vulgare]
MLSFGIRSGSDVDYDEELTLHIDLERSKVNTRSRSFRAGPKLDPPDTRVALAGQRSRYQPHIVSFPCRPLLHAGQQLVLVPASSVRTCTSDLEARAVCRERQRTKERETIEQFTRHRRGMPTEPDEDERLLTWVYHRSLVMAETNARRLRRKNAKALRLAIEQLKHATKDATTEAVRVAKLKREPDRMVRQMKGLIVLSVSDVEDGYNRTSSSDD